jgi:hypothetical protein
VITIVTVDRYMNTRRLFSLRLNDYIILAKYCKEKVINNVV